MPESVRSYMTIEEVRALIATRYRMGGLKTPICFPASADCVSAILSA